MYIDTHCHLDSTAYDEVLEQVLSNSLSLGVQKIVIPGADIIELPKAIKIAEKYDRVYFAVGIHPSEIANLNKDSMALLKDSISHKKCVAVGEIGLDYHYSGYDKELQERGFREQIHLALESNKPIIIHTRESNSDTIRILKDYENDITSLIFHCFSGDMQLVNALKCKCYYGIGGVISFKNANLLRDSVKKLELDSILLETDAPFLAPTPHRGKTNTPEYIPLIASYLAEVLGINIATLAALSTKNANNVFRF